MNPFSNSALSLRRRSIWEAADSGVLLWRSNFVYFIPFFAIPFWIAACSLRFLPADYIYLSYLILWWLKPFFDRLVLHVISLRFFGSPAPCRFRELRKGLWRNIHTGLLGDLLWRRLSPARAARMPIRVLERIGRKQFRLRKKALGIGGLDFCSLLSALGLALEALLLLGEIVCFMMMAHIFFPSALAYLRDNPVITELLIYSAFCFNYMLAESFYVCMGFGLYINSRVEVEGWDLQLLFQKFAETETSTKRFPLKTGGTALLFLCLFLFLSPAIHADTESRGYFPEEFPFASERSMEDLENILASPDFGSEKEGWEIRLKRRGERPELPLINYASWMERIRKIFAFMLRFLAVIIFVGFAGFAFYWLRKNKNKGMFRFKRRGKSYTNPRVIADSPQTLFARAEDYFSRGDLREAWAACLAGCLAAFGRYRRLSFPADATEYGCLGLVQKALPAEASPFEDLVQSWIFFAYGGKAPGQGAFEKALVYGRSIVSTEERHEP